MKDKALADEILRRVDAEQEVRKAAVAGRAKRSEYKKLDRQNSAWLKRVFKESGFPTYALIGKKAMDGLGLLIRHADHDREFQKNSLVLIKRLHKKDPKSVPGVEIAYLTDRLLANEGKPLVYGTLYDVSGLEVTPRPIRDMKNVNKRRRAIGIMTTVEGRRRALIRELKSLGAK